MSPKPDIKALGEVLHQRILGGDELAVSDLCDQLLPTVTAALLRNNSKLDDHLIHTAVADAFLNYINIPSSFDPTRSSLVSYLRMSAQRDLQNALKTLRRREKVVELRLDDPEHVVSDEGEGDIEHDLVLKESPLVKKVFELLTDETDRQIVVLMMDGFRDAKEFVDVLGIAHLPQEDQQAEVKRNKDRIRAVLKRKLNPKAGK
jgi:DNA-directed RNA polymerase specialized sigma24 family protein